MVIRILSWNVLDRELNRRSHGIVSAICAYKPDIVLLQETDLSLARQVAEELTLSRRHDFYSVVHGGDLALVSRWAVEESYCVSAPGIDAAHQVFSIVAHLKSEGHHLFVANVHLCYIAKVWETLTTATELSPIQEGQIRAQMEQLFKLRCFIDKCGFDRSRFVLGGDLNSTPQSDSYRELLRFRLRDSEGGNSRPTVELPHPLNPLSIPPKPVALTLDYIFFGDGVSMSGNLRVDRETLNVSDHALIVGTYVL